MQCSPGFHWLCTSHLHHILLYITIPACTEVLEFTERLFCFPWPTKISEHFYCVRENNNTVKINHKWFYKMQHGIYYHLMCLLSTLIHLFLQYVFPKVSLANNSEIKGHSNHVLSLLTDETNHFLYHFLCIATFFSPIDAFLYKITGPDKSYYINITSTGLHLGDAFQPKDTKINY